MLLEVAFQSDQIGQLPQSLKQRGGVLSVFDSVRIMTTRLEETVQN